MSEYFDRIEAHLLDAVERQAAGRANGGPTVARHSHTRAARRAASWTLAAASVVVAVLVFLGALLIAGGSNGRQAAAPAGASPSRAELVRLLGVLRTPQTAADRAFDHTGWPTPPRAPGSRIEPDRPLIRLATVTPWGAKVFIVPLTPPASPVLARELGETVALWVQGMGWSDYSAASQIEAGQVWGPGATVRGSNGLKSRFFTIVPDGVAKVVFYVLRSPPGQATPSQVSRGITAPVHNNVAAFQLTTGRAGAYPVNAAWYSASGRLIKRVGNWNSGNELGKPFPLAPRTQPGGWSDSQGPCALAPPNPYLPKRSGCVSAAIAEVDGQPDLFLLYARLGNQRLDGGFLPTAFTLKVVRANGPTFTLVGLPHSLASPEIVRVRNVNRQPGTEIFVHDGHLSSGESVAVYTFDGRELREADGFTYGGDSAQQYGFTCRSGQTGLIIQGRLRGPTATITQHEFLLQSGGANARWSERDAVFAWVGARLEHIVTLTSTHRFSRDVGGLAFPPKSLTSFGC